MRKYLLPILLIGFWGCEDSESNASDNLTTDDSVKFEGFWSIDSMWNTEDQEWNEQTTFFLEVQPELWTWYAEGNAYGEDLCYMILGSYLYSLDTLNDTTFNVQFLPNEGDSWTDTYQFEEKDKFVGIWENERRIIYGRIEPITFEPICEEE